MKNIPPPPPPRQPKWYAPAHVPKYLRTRHNFDVTRKTVYNWMTIGRAGVKLRGERRGVRTVISDIAIDSFVRHLRDTSPNYG